MRWAFLLFLIALASACGSAADSEWRMFQHDAAHSGYNPSPSSLDLNSVGPLWSVDLGENGYSPPVAADLDGKGGLEVVVASASGRIHAMRGDGEPLWDFRAGGPIAASPAVARSGANAFVTFSAGSSAYLIDSRGSRVWAATDGEDIQMVPPQIADLNHDGASEIIYDDIVFKWDGTFTNHSREDLLAMGVAPPKGSVVMVNNVNATVFNGTVFMVPAFADLNGDGVVYVVRGGSAERGIQGVFSAGLDGQIVWSLNGTKITSPPVIADIDGDGTKEVLACTAEGSVAIISSHGLLRSHVKSGDCSHVILADLDLDGRLEIITSSRDGWIRVFGYSNDSDSDGLSDFKEGILGTDKFKRDTDNDGLDDAIDPQPLIPKSFKQVEARGWSWRTYVIFGLFFAFLVAMYVLFSLMMSSKKVNTYWASARKKLSLTRKQIEEISSLQDRSMEMVKTSKGVLEKDWDDILYSESVAEDKETAKKLLRLVRDEGEIKADEAAGRLKISKIKLANYCMKLEQHGYVKVDSSRDASNPYLRATEKLKGLG